MNTPKILVVDDDSKLTGLLRVILERVGGFQRRDTGVSGVTHDGSRTSVQHTR